MPDSHDLNCFSQNFLHFVFVWLQKKIQKKLNRLVSIQPETQSYTVSIQKVSRAVQIKNYFNKNILRTSHSSFLTFFEGGSWQQPLREAFKKFHTRLGVDRDKPWSSVRMNLGLIILFSGLWTLNLRLWTLGLTTLTWTRQFFFEWIWA